MTNEQSSERAATRETYLQLCRLAHESFEQRRGYEWKMHFGLWIAVGAIVFAAAKEKIAVFSCSSEAVFVGVILWLSYFLHYFMVYRGHAIDKEKKHYYMAKAEGLSGPSIEKQKLPNWAVQVLWTIPYMVFTGLLIYLALKVLLRIHPAGQAG